MDRQVRAWLALLGPAVRELALQLALLGPALLELAQQVGVGAGASGIALISGSTIDGAGLLG